MTNSISVLTQNYRCMKLIHAHICFLNRRFNLAFFWAYTGLEAWIAQFKQSRQAQGYPKKDLTKSWSCLPCLLLSSMTWFRSKIKQNKKHLENIRRKEDDNNEAGPVTHSGEQQGKQKPKKAKLTSFGQQRGQPWWKQEPEHSWELVANKAISNARKL